MKTTLRFLGANRQVTGSCTLLEAGGKRILIDCGMFQERDLLGRNWEPKPVEPSAIDYLLLSHAHLDHVGLIPRLVRDGFEGRILATAPTLELAEIVLRDSARIQEEDAAFKLKRHAREGREGPRPVAPLYRMADVEAALPLFRGTAFRTPLKLDGSLSVRFLEAGHILGAASVEVSLRRNGVSKRILFSGDLGQTGVPIVPDPARIEEADCVVLESTYGDRDHEPRTEVRGALAEVVLDTLKRGGNLLIPTFAIERAQELLLELGELFLSKGVPPVPVYLDSPMAADATEIYRRYPEFMDDEMRATIEGQRLEGVRRLLTVVRTSEESKALNRRRGCIILAGAGMCTGGRIKHHLLEHIGLPESTVLFVGYQAEGTLGRRIRDGHREVRILGQECTVRARIASIEGMSGHADRGQLLSWLGPLSRQPGLIAINHGAEEASRALRERIRERRGWDSVVPRYEQRIEL